MKRARVVVGAAFGDEGKGLMTDYFCRQAADNPIVVRFNGGAQAGHTVVTPEGQRHVFHHFGAGTFAGAETFLSKYFLVNPIAWREESEKLVNAPKLLVDPYAPVTTIYDIYVNQQLEKTRNRPHGSCGMGVHETMLRQEDPLLRLYACDISPDSHRRVMRIRDHAIDRLAFAGLYYEEQRDFLRSEEVFSKFMFDCHEFREGIFLIQAASIQNNELVFEGAQGLLLDSENQQFFPHVTHSRTGLTNVIALAKDMNIDNLDVTYVARSYLTRHGAGPLPGEDLSMIYEDNTNQPNPWQGTLRFAPQDWNLVSQAIWNDISEYSTQGIDGIDINPDMAVTHLDQCPIEVSKSEISVLRKYESFGPTWKDVNALCK